MRKNIILKRLSVFLFVACFGIQNLPGTSAQRGSDAKQAAAKEKEDPAIKLNEDLEAAVKAIEKNCNSLRDTIVAANVLNAEFGYDDNRVSGSFLADCNTNGELSWTAKQKFDEAVYTTRRAYRTYVKGYALELEASQAKETGLVELISETASITVVNLLNWESEDQVTWPLDLRSRKYAVKFVTALKELAANLKKRDDLQEEIDKLAAAKAKAEEAKAKPKPKRPVRKRRNKKK